MSGYYSLGSSVKSNIINSYPTDSQLMGVTRVLISLLVACTFPLQAHPFRASLSQLVSGEPVPSLGLRMLFAMLYCGTAWMIAMIVTDFGVVLSLNGAIGNGIFNLIFPGVLYFMSDESYGILKILSILLTIFGLFVMFVGCISLFVTF